jgi:hypothetical protein
MMSFLSTLSWLIPIRAFAFRADARIIFSVARNPLMPTTLACVLIDFYFSFSHDGAQYIPLLIYRQVSNSLDAVMYL